MFKRRKSKIEQNALQIKMGLCLTSSRDCIAPIVAKVGGLQSQGGNCEAAAVKCENLPTKDLKYSGFPEGGKDGNQ